MPLPGNRRGLGHAGRDFNAQIGEVVADRKPNGLRVAIGGEDLRVKLFAARLHLLLDLLDSDSFDHDGVLEIIFEIPADVFLLLLGELQTHHVCLGFQIRLAVPPQRESDGVVAISRSGLTNMQCGHGANPLLIKLADGSADREMKRHP